MKKFICSAPQFRLFGSAQRSAGTGNMFSVLCFATLAATAIACGGGASPPAQMARSEAAPASESRFSPASRPDSPLGAAATRDKQEADDRESRGLGTSWGETRHSSVHEVPFERSSERPEAVVTLRYDDAAGLRRLMQRSNDEDAFRSRKALTVDEGSASLDIHVENDDDEAFPLFVARGSRAMSGYLEGTSGAHYKIVVRNLGDNRHEIVASVDGLDVIDGRDASYTKRGYLLAPHGRVVIDGFRKSDDAIAAFRFGRTDDAYAAKKSGGTIRDVGVIGLAIFGDLETRNRDTERRQRANPFPGNGPNDSRYAREPD